MEENSLDLNGMSTEKRLVYIEQALYGLERASANKNDLEEKKHLKELLSLLALIGYSKSNLAAALDLDALTIHRWQTGGGMKVETFNTLTSFVRSILTGKPQHPIRVSDTGLVAWEYIFQERQPLAQWIWYISDEPFLLMESRSIRERVRNLFVAEEQENRAREIRERTNERTNPIVPKMIYVFTENSSAERNLKQWLHYLNSEQQYNPHYLRGTILGLKISKPEELPWFFPEIRNIILDIDEELEGYIRLPLPQENEMAILKAMGIENNNDSENIPWISLNRRVVNKCFSTLDLQYTTTIRKTLNDHTGFLGKIIPEYED